MSLLCLTVIASYYAAEIDPHAPQPHLQPAHHPPDTHATTASSPGASITASLLLRLFPSLNRPHAPQHDTRSNRESQLPRPSRPSSRSSSSSSSFSSSFSSLSCARVGEARGDDGVWGRFPHTLRRPIPLAFSAAHPTARLAAESSPAGFRGGGLVVWHRPLSLRPAAASSRSVEARGMGQPSHWRWSCGANGAAKAAGTHRNDDEQRVGREGRSRSDCSGEGESVVDDTPSSSCGSLSSDSSLSVSSSGSSRQAIAPPPLLYFSPAMMSQQQQQQHQEPQTAKMMKEAPRDRRPIGVPAECKGEEEEEDEKNEERENKWRTARRATMSTKTALGAPPPLPSMAKTVVVMHLYDRPNTAAADETGKGEEEARGGGTDGRRKGSGSRPCVDSSSSHDHHYHQHCQMCAVPGDDTVWCLLQPVLWWLVRCVQPQHHALPRCAADTFVGNATPPSTAPSSCVADAAGSGGTGGGGEEEGEEACTCCRHSSSPPQLGCALRLFVSPWALPRRRRVVAFPSSSSSSSSPSPPRRPPVDASRPARCGKTSQQYSRDLSCPSYRCSCCCCCCCCGCSCSWSWWCAQAVVELSLCGPDSDSPYLFTAASFLSGLPINTNEAADIAAATTSVSGSERGRRRSGESRGKQQKQRRRFNKGRDGARPAFGPFPTPHLSTGLPWRGAATWRTPACGVWSSARRSQNQNQQQQQPGALNAADAASCTVARESTELEEERWVGRPLLELLSPQAVWPQMQSGACAAFRCTAKSIGGETDDTEIEKEEGKSGDEGGRWRRHVVERNHHHHQHQPHDEDGDDGSSARSSSSPEPPLRLHAVESPLVTATTTATAPAPAPARVGAAALNTRSPLRPPLLPLHTLDLSFRTDLRQLEDVLQQQWGANSLREGRGGRGGSAFLFDRLSRLSVMGCTQLRHLDWLSAMPAAAQTLEVLNVSGCAELRDLRPVRRLSALRVLKAAQLPQLERLGWWEEEEEEEEEDGEDERGAGEKGRAAGEIAAASTAAVSPCRLAQLQELDLACTSRRPRGLEDAAWIGQLPSLRKLALSVAVDDEKGGNDHDTENEDRVGAVVGGNGGGGTRRATTLRGTRTPTARTRTSEEDGERRGGGTLVRESDSLLHSPLAWLANCTQLRELRLAFRDGPPDGGRNGGPSRRLTAPPVPPLLLPHSSQQHPFLRPRASTQSRGEQRSETRGGGRGEGETGAGSRAALDVLAVRPLPHLRCLELTGATLPANFTRWLAEGCSRLQEIELNSCVVRCTAEELRRAARQRLSSPPPRPLPTHSHTHTHTRSRSTIRRGDPPVHDERHGSPHGHGYHHLPHDVDDAMDVEDNDGQLRKRHEQWWCGQLCRLRHLRRLSLYDLAGLQSGHALDWVAGCRGLRHLTLRKCPWLLDAYALHRLPQLRTLNLAGTGIDDLTWMRMRDGAMVQAKTTGFAPHRPSDIEAKQTRGGRRAVGWAVLRRCRPQSLWRRLLSPTTAPPAAASPTREGNETEEEGGGGGGGEEGEPVAVAEVPSGVTAGTAVNAAAMPASTPPLPSPTSKRVGVESLAVPSPFPSFSPSPAAAALSTLTEVVLVDCPFLSDLSPLAYLTSCRSLFASDHAVTNLDHLSTCLSLEQLYLIHYAQLSDLSALRWLAKLRVVYVTHSSVRDLSWVAAPLPPPAAEGVQDSRRRMVSRNAMSTHNRGSSQSSSSSSVGDRCTQDAGGHARPPAPRHINASATPRYGGPFSPSTNNRQTPCLTCEKYSAERRDNDDVSGDDSDDALGSTDGRVLPRLHTLTLAYSRFLTDISPLGALPRLRHLDVRECVSLHRLGPPPPDGSAHARGAAAAHGVRGTRGAGGGLTGTGRGGRGHKVTPAAPRTCTTPARDHVRRSDDDDEEGGSSGGRGEEKSTSVALWRRWLAASRATAASLRWVRRRLSRDAADTPVAVERSTEDRATSKGGGRGGGGGQPTKYRSKRLEGSNGHRHRRSPSLPPPPTTTTTTTTAPHSSLAQCAPTLTFLSLSGCTRLVEAAVLGQLVHLQYLHAAFTGISDGRWLAHCTSLRVLDLTMAPLCAAPGQATALLAQLPDTLRALEVLNGRPVEKAVS